MDIPTFSDLGARLAAAAAAEQAALRARDEAAAARAHQDLMAIHREVARTVDAVVERINGELGRLMADVAALRRADELAGAVEAAPANGHADVVPWE